MEEAKYYTPDISEFHVGFEFEQKYEGEWKHEKFTILEGSCTWVTEARVKHLDKADIESLGWKYEQTAHGATHYGKGEHKLAYGGDGKVKIFATNIKGAIVCIFMGTLKNKGEFIKLLKQLGLWVKIV